MRTIQKKGAFSEDFSLKKKRGSFREALTLVQNSIEQLHKYLLPNKYWVHITRWSFIGENGRHSVRASTPIFTDKYF